MTRRRFLQILSSATAALALEPTLAEAFQAEVAPAIEQLSVLSGEPLYLQELRLYEALMAYGWKLREAGKRHQVPKFNLAEARAL